MLSQRSFKQLRESVVCESTDSGLKSTEGSSFVGRRILGCSVEGRSIPYFDSPLDILEESNIEISEESCPTKTEPSLDSAEERVNEEAAVNSDFQLDIARDPNNEGSYINDNVWLDDEDESKNGDYADVRLDIVDECTHEASTAHRDWAMITAGDVLHEDDSGHFDQ